MADERADKYESHAYGSTSIESALSFGEETRNNRVREGANRVHVKVEAAKDAKYYVIGQKGQAGFAG